jgi:hypothetical protein
MTNQHPITPPPELVQQWFEEGLEFDAPTRWHIATRAAHWGADQQLANDAEWLDHNALNEPHLRITPMSESLKKAMRPKPLTVKEQALRYLNRAYNKDQIDDTTFENIQKVLEALPND